MARASEQSIAAVARELGLHPQLLYKWKAKAEHGQVEFVPHIGNEPATEAEVRRLKRELARVKEERDILKKAVGYFAQEK